MWQRTKRLINSYLDQLIERISGPDRDIRDVTRAELARLNEMEVQTRASAKLFEKELAEVDLKIAGASERERLLREQGDEAGASAAGKVRESLMTQRELLAQQLVEANAVANKVKNLRDNRKVEGGSLATETRLAVMRESLSELHTPFSSTDPAGTIDEMRARIGRSGPINTALEDADRELEQQKAQARVDEMLARYKQGVQGAPESAVGSPGSTAESQQAPSTEEADEASTAGQKTLGRNEGPVRPID